jgi:hypothetical protein
MNKTDIDERISDILAEMTDLATDADLSYGEVLIEVGLAMIRECTGQDLTAEEKAKETNQFLQALQQKAQVAAAEAHS